VTLELDRIDLIDLRAPGQLARRIHAQLGCLPGPVSVDAIAAALDVGQVRRDSFDGFEGMLLTDRVRSTGAILANTKRGCGARASRSPMSLGIS
jgi:hypothetical protein